MPEAYRKTSHPARVVIRRRPRMPANEGTEFGAARWGTHSFMTPTWDEVACSGARSRTRPGGYRGRSQGVRSRHRPEALARSFLLAAQLRSWRRLKTISASLTPRKKAAWTAGRASCERSPWATEERPCSSAFPDSSEQGGGRHAQSNRNSFNVIDPTFRWPRSSELTYVLSRSAPDGAHRSIQHQGQSRDDCPIRPDRRRARLGLRRNAGTPVETFDKAGAAAA